MKSKNLFMFTVFFLAQFLTVGCAPSISNSFKDQISVIVKEGTTLETMTNQGVNYVQFTDQLTKVKSAYNLALLQWPKEFSGSGKNELQEAIKGWDLAKAIWDMKIHGRENPVEGSALFNDLVNYEGKRVVISRWDTPGFPEKNKKRYILYEENVGIIFLVATNKFDAAKISLSEALK